MIILAVDDEYLGLEALTEAIRKAEPDSNISSFDSPYEALDFIKKEHVNVAFLDIFMADMSGIDLAKKIKMIDPLCHIIFATGYDEYMKDAFELHATGYIMKPITEAKVKNELNNLKRMYETNIFEERSNGKRVRFQCFGNFEVYVDGKPIRFKYDRTKEMLAYIVARRGALCTNGEITVNLWEDDNNHDSYLRGIRKDLMDILKQYNLDDIIFQQRGKIAIDTGKVDCDYYDFIKGDAVALNMYKGEFMSQYSWSEMLNAEMYISGMD